MPLLAWIFVCAAGVLASAFANWFPRPPRLKNGHLVTAVVVLVLAAAVVNFGFQSEPDEDGRTRLALPEPTPDIVIDTYVLRVSNFVDTNDEDKIDLDTGCPGWADMWPRVGPRRCGELSDVVVDEEGVHTGDDKPRLVRLDNDVAGSYEACRAGLAERPDSRTGQIPLAALAVGDELCVETDLDHIGLVTIDDIVTKPNGELRELTISFTVWTTRAVTGGAGG